jgi:hypothetical protein
MQHLVHMGNCKQRQPNIQRLDVTSYRHGAATIRVQVHVNSDQRHVMIAGSDDVKVLMTSCYGQSRHDITGGVLGQRHSRHKLQLAAWGCDFLKHNEVSHNQVYLHRRQ